MTTTKRYELRTSAIRAARNAGLKDGEYEVVQVWEDKGKSHWEFKPTTPVAIEPAPVAAPGPTTTEQPAEAPKLVIQDYTDQPKTEEPPVATESATHEAKPKSKSTVANPTKAAWAIADEMKAASPAVTRKQVVEECVRRGIALYTARTQYQRWSKARKATAAG